MSCTKTFFSSPFEYNLTVIWRIRCRWCKIRLQRQLWRSKALSWLQSSSFWNDAFDEVTLNTELGVITRFCVVRHEQHYYRRNHVTHNIINTEILANLANCFWLWSVSSCCREQASSLLTSSHWKKNEQNKWL